MIANGLNAYVNTVQSRVVEGTFTHLLAFIISLTDDQLQQLQQEQLSFARNSFVYISQEFVEQQIAKDVIQMSLLQNSQIWKVAKGDYLVNCNLPISIGNLKESGGSKVEQMKQQDKDNKFIEMLRQVPQFIETLLPAQQRILQNVIKRGMALKYFFVSIHESQLTDFEQVHQNL